MPGTPRNITKWRQGHVLADEAIVEFGLAFPTELGKTIAVVVSHDCDIAADSAREPIVEFVIGKRIDRLGGDANAKTARRLDLPFRQGDVDVPFQFEITSKATLPKERVLASTPRADMALSPEARVILQHWLAARYHRAEFADAFEDRLKAKPSKLAEKIAKAMDEAGEHVLAVFFEVDDGEDVERVGPQDLYQLRIVLLYNSMNDEAVAYAAAEKAADRIEKDFEDALRKDGRWREIKLLSCAAVSDNAMTMAQSRLLKRWRLDHMSFKDDPPKVMLPPN